MKFLIAGLGNIGPQYQLTRHNIGFLVADRLAEVIGATPFKLERLAMLSTGSYKGKQIIILKPTTFMNLSGTAVRYYKGQEKINIENIIAVCDDLALPYGTLRLKTKGSAGGQNGLKNIEECLMTQDYARIRFGIGSNFGKGQQSNYVLSNFSKDEMIDLETHINRAVDAILSFCAEGAAIAMNKFN